MRYPRRVRTFVLIGLAAAAVGWTGSRTPIPAADPAPDDVERQFRDTIRPILQANCFGCHGKEKTSGDVDLSRFTTAADVAADFPHWETMLDQLGSGQMPPKKAKARPTDEQRKAVLAWTDSLRRVEARKNAGDPGVVLARRLNNAEYDNTIRDLTGVDIRPAREFPVDPANAAGFDNTGESLAMSPALVNKYLAAARSVANYILFTPDGIEFAPFPVVADTDRDKYCVRKIVDFYLHQPTDLAAYFRAAWEFRHRETLNKSGVTLADIAVSAKVSPRYLALVWETLNTPAGDVGPVAALQTMWNGLPAPPAEARKGCDDMRDFVKQLREAVKVKVKNLAGSNMADGSQALVFWKDKQMAANRRAYGGNGLKLDPDDFEFGPAVRKALTPPTDAEGKKKFDEQFKQFCSVFPDAFYIKERGRVFLDPSVDRLNTGRLLSAGLHNQMGYFRDDGPLCELILDDAGRRQLDRLWDEFTFACDLPARTWSGHIWFERAESHFIVSKEFDFARPEDKDIGEPEKFHRFAELYLAKVKRGSTNPDAIQAVRDHFAESEANLRRIEKQRVAAEPADVKALKEFAGRAYRRRLTDAERDGISSFYQSLRKDGVAPEEAARDTFASILMSPYFLFRVDLPVARETQKPGRVEPLSDIALASRLSYFLWASTPDKELMDLAAAGRLHEPDVLRAQARRMLNDEKVRGLVTQFGGNWLDFRRFDEHNAVDRGRYPQFDNDLRQAMYEEPIRFLLDLVQNDRSVLELIDGKYTFVNAPLAKHYGMPVPSGNEWVRVADADKYGRGGLLPMSVFLTKNSPGLRTSPVKRGYWVVTRLLGERIPPPPPNVPVLPADEKNLGEITLRETLARHRDQAACASCHTRFDSFGLAFEGFGPIGERRTKDLAGHAVDTKVDFPGGSIGDGVAGLRAYLDEKRRDAFLDTLCRKLLAYGLGRELILSDDVTIAAMREQLARNDFRFGGLIEIIVSSPQFRNRRGAG
jgi:mono/diheme cytochrome c family protein